MLKKMMKYEFRATGRIMLPLYAGMILIGILARFAFMVLDRDDQHWTVELLSMLVVIVFVVSFMAIGFGVLAVTLTSFQRSILSDEGYLTMTLPVSTNKLISAKLIVATVWYFATAVVMLVEGFMFAFSGNDWAELLGGFGELFRGIGELIQVGRGDMVAHGIGFVLELLVVIALAAALVSLVGYACMGIGYSFDKNKKLITGLCAFGFYLGVQFAGFGAVGLFAMRYSNFSEAQMEAVFRTVWSYHLALLVPILITAALCALFYFITHYFLTKRLNLE